MRTSTWVALPLSIAAATQARAQAVDGVLDTSFGGGSGQNVVAFDRGASNKDYARAIVVDNAGRSYLVGDVDTSSGRKIGIVRLLASGAADESYGADMNARVVAPSGQTSITVTSAALDAQGYLLVAGSKLISGTDTSFLVCRFAPDGTLANFAGGQAACSQPDFNAGGFHTDVAASILVQPDGKIVLAGYASSDTGTTLALTRLQPNGALDTGFGNAGKTTYTGAPFVSFDATRIRLNPDGSFITAGSAYDADALRFGVLVHVGADGVVDTTFSGNHGYARSPSSKMDFADVVWDPQWNNYVAIGNHHETSGTYGETHCYLKSGGGVSCPHNGGGDYHIGHDVQFTTLLHQADGRWLVAGTRRAIENGPTDLFLARLDPALALDTAEFAAPAGYAVHDLALPGHQGVGTTMTMQQGRILVAGAALRTPNTNNYDFAIAAFALDRIFQTGLEKP
jgi:uncharacterized delta-60 repeat protein